MPKQKRRTPSFGDNDMAVAVTETPAIDKPIQIIKMKGRTSKSLFSKGFSE